ncbi:NACHT domain-containing protein [Kitasatospora sp. NPDC048365]|uniref:NACHT and WD40 repeat domain-containing protein n=1 Tax=Kitasatospora sp. NPDC048365 TaxID=3364050 RepID=UPI00372259A7
MGRRGWTVSAALAAVALGLVGSLATNTVQVEASWWPPLVWTVTGLAALGALWFPLRAERLPAPPGTLDEAVEALRATVHVQWQQEAVVLALDAPMPVRWDLVTDVSVAAGTGGDGASGDARGAVSFGPVVWSGSGDRPAELTDRFLRLPRQRLVVTGGPGAGKSTLAIQVVRRLSAAGQSGPVPVLLPLSDWDVDQFPTLEEWLVVRLGETYEALRETSPFPARTLFRAGRLLPVLDGLDEAPATARPLLLNRINEALTEDSWLIVTTRPDEYADAVRAARSIRGAGMLVPRPFTPQQAADHLSESVDGRAVHPGRERFLEELRRGSTPSAEVAATPLGLWLLRTVCAESADPSELLDRERFPTARELRAHLFDRLIPALLDARPPAAKGEADLFRPRRAHDAADVERWLGNLAALLDGSPVLERRVGARSYGVREFAWWALARTARPDGRLPGVAVKLAVALVGLAWTLLTCRVLLGPSTVFAMILWFLGCSYVYETADDLSWGGQLPGRADLRLTGRLGRLIGRLAAACGGALLLALVCGLIYGLLGQVFEGDGIAAGLRYGLGLGTLALLIRLHAAVTTWAEPVGGAWDAITPLTDWRADRRLNLFRILTAAALAGGTGALLTALTGHPLRETLPVAALGAVAGAAYGALVGRQHAWLAYLTAVFRLSFDGVLPRRLMVFLDDAHRLGLLRSVGPWYQFRHAEFHDHLGVRHSPGAPTPPLPLAAPAVATAPPPPRRDPARLRPVRLATLATPKLVAQVAFTPDGRGVALFRPGRTLLVDLSGRPVRSFRHGWPLWAQAYSNGGIAFSPDGGRFAATGAIPRLTSADRLAGRWQILPAAGGTALLSGFHESEVRAVAFSPDGALLATGGTRTVRLWRAADGAELLTIGVAWVNGLSFSPDGTRLAVVSNGVWPPDDTCHAEVWDLAGGQAVLELQAVPTGSTLGVEGVAFSPDGTLLATACRQATQLWDAGTGDEVLQIPDPSTRVVFSPDGSLLATVSGKHARLWDARTGARLLEIPHGNWVQAVAFSPDGALLATASDDRTAQIWRLWPE